MPVKVRCSGCERVVAAPDRARGKAVKCPQCGKPIRVPAAAAAPVAKKASPSPSSSMVLANLDLDRIEDAQTRICPKCGTEVSSEDVECPECGVNLTTGQLSAERQADRDRKGPNPARYYKEFFGDSFEFWRKNKKLSIGLALNCVIFAGLGVCCIFMALWCAKPLVRVYWWFMATIWLAVPPGLAWNLHTKIIDLTLRKKKKLPKHHFEKLLGAALGFKLVFWFLDVAAPLHLLALIFLLLRFPLVAAGLEVPAVIFATLLFPLAMSHMAMPVTIRGWLINKMTGPFFRTLPALVYWAFFAFLMMIVPIGCIAGGAVMGGQELGQLVDDSNFNSELFSKKAEIENLPKNSTMPDELREWQSKKERALNWSPFWIPGGLLVGAAGFFGATAVLLMRANGLYARYFLDYLDLETMEPEVKYVAKVASIDQLEGKKGLTWKTVWAALALAGVFGFAFGGAGAAITGKDFLFGVGLGLLAVGMITGLTGQFWLMFEAFMDSMAWFGALSLSITVSGSVFPFFGFVGVLGSIPLTALISIIYGAINWSNVKYPLVIQLTGFFFYLPLGLIVMILSIGMEFLGVGGGSAPE